MDAARTGTCRNRVNPNGRDNGGGGIDTQLGSPEKLKAARPMAGPGWICSGHRRQSIAVTEIGPANTALPTPLSGENACARWSRRSAGPFQAAFGLDEADDAVQPLALLQVGHDERSLAAHAPGVRLHLFQGGADIGRQVDLVDHKEVGPGDAGAALGRDLVAG